MLEGPVSDPICSVIFFFVFCLFLVFFLFFDFFFFCFYLLDASFLLIIHSQTDLLGT